MENTWIAAGYNVLGFNDRDFAGAEYRAKGFFLSVRIKFDQDTLGLNKTHLIFEIAMSQVAIDADTTDRMRWR